MAFNLSSACAERVRYESVRTSFYVTSYPGQALRGLVSMILGVAISDSHHLEGVSTKNQQKPLKILGSL